MVTERLFPNIDTDRCEHNIGGTTCFPVSAHYVNTRILVSGVVPAHWHGEVEAFFIPEGNGWLNCDGREYELDTGVGGLINSNVCHTIYSDRGRDFVYKSVIFRPGIIAGSTAQTIAERYIAALTECDALPCFTFDGAKPWHHDALLCIQKAHMAMEEEPLCFELEVAAWLTMLWKLIFQNESQTIKLANKGENNNTIRAKKVLQYMQDHIYEHISLEQLAAVIMVSSRECERGFQKVYGIPPMRYLQQLRIEQASQLLLTSNLSITEISSLCGFESASYFSQKFKRYMNCTPREYRNEAH